MRYDFDTFAETTLGTYKTVFDGTAEVFCIHIVIVVEQLTLLLQHEIQVTKKVGLFSCFSAVDAVIRIGGQEKEKGKYLRQSIYYVLFSKTN